MLALAFPDVKEIVNLWARSSAAVKSMLAGSGNECAKAGDYLCLACHAEPSGCETSQSQDYQFQKQVTRAQECRQLQGQTRRRSPLTPERGEEIAKTTKGIGCTARLP
jgi:hypothetical protein